MKKQFKKFYRQLKSTLKEEIILELEQRNNLTEQKVEELDKPMTSKEITEHYNIHISTLNRYVKQGLKNQSKGKGCKKFYTRRKFEEFMANKKSKR